MNLARMAVATSIRQILIGWRRVPFASQTITPVHFRAFLRDMTFWSAHGISCGSHGVLLSCGKNRLRFHCVALVLLLSSLQTTRICLKWAAKIITLTSQHGAMNADMKVMRGKPVPMLHGWVRHRLVADILITTTHAASSKVKKISQVLAPCKQPLGGC